MFMFCTAGTAAGEKAASAMEICIEQSNSTLDRSLGEGKGF